MADVSSRHLGSKGDDVPGWLNDFETERICVFATCGSPQSRAMPHLRQRDSG